MKAWMLTAIAVVLILCGIGLAVGGSIWYTRSQLQHECQALEFIQHANIQNKQFLSAVNYWASADGC